MRLPWRKKDDFVSRHLAWLKDCLEALEANDPQEARLVAIQIQNATKAGPPSIEMVEEVTELMLAALDRAGKRIAV